MVSKQKKPVGGGRSEAEKQSIRKQLVWVAVVLLVALTAFMVLRWGQDTGWGNPDRAVKARFAKGEAAFVAGDFAAAAEQYAQVVEKYAEHPQTNQALTQLASAYQGSGRLEMAQSALEQLTRRLEEANDRSDLHAYTLLQLGKMQKERMDFERALATLERVRAEHPKTDWSGEALNTSAQVFQAQHRYQEARGAYGQLIKELPGGFLAAEAQAGIGACYEAEEKPRLAVAAYQVVLDKYPSAVWETAKARIDALKKDLAAAKKSKS